MGENHFLFTFLHPTGKAIAEGPWMFGKDLVVMVDYDASKTIKKMEFVSIPIWIRVLKMPLVIMNRS